AHAQNIYKIAYSVADSHKDSTSLYFALAHIDTNFFFANGTCLFGYVNDKKNMRAEVKYLFPDSWKLSTALDPIVAFPNEYYSHPGFGFGALEHANSSAYLLVNAGWGMFRQFGFDILSHEFFHLWNVKRIHSSLLGPFDYAKRVMTTSLWLSEGITDYYAHTILTRWKIAPYRLFESMLSELSHAAQRSAAAK